MASTFRKGERGVGNPQDLTQTLRNSSLRETLPASDAMIDESRHEHAAVHDMHRFTIAMKIVVNYGRQEIRHSPVFLT